MRESETSITKRLKRALGKGYSVFESPISRAERVTINKLRSHADCPTKEEVDALAKEMFPDAEWRARDYEGMFFYPMQADKDNDVILEFSGPSDYRGHFMVFGNGSQTMLALAWRGRYPTKKQENRYVKLVTETYSRFYQVENKEQWAFVEEIKKQLEKERK